MNVLALASILAVTGITWCQDDIMTNLNPPPIRVEIPKKNEDVEKAIREKCIKANGEEAFIDLQESKEKFKKCLTSIVDIERVQEDIEILQTDLDLLMSIDELYNTSVIYCKHGPEIMDCLNIFASKWERCLSDEEKDSFKLISNLTETLVEFICAEEAERLEDFITDGGVKCLLDHRERFGDCFNKSVKNMWLSDVTLDDIHLLSEDEDCKKFENFQNCIIKEFDTCKENGSFDVIQDLFNQVRLILPCDNMPETSTNSTDFYTETNTTRYDQSDKKERTKRDKFGSGRNNKCTKNIRNPYMGLELLSDSYQHFVRFLVEDKLFSNCSERLKKFENMIGGVTRNFKECLTEEHQLLELVEDSTESILNFVRKDDGMHFCDFHASLAVMCLLHSDEENYNKCLGEKKNYPLENGEVIYERELLCENLKTYKTCTQDFLNSSCDSPDIVVQKEFLHDLLDEVHSPCAAANSTVANSFMILSVILFVQNFIFKM